VIANDPPPPRLSATILLTRDDPFEVLMVRRHSRAVFGSALVFPGGAIEPNDHDPTWAQLTRGDVLLGADERALRIGALRETWEETSILLGFTADGAPLHVTERMRGAAFREVVEATGAMLDLGALQPFGHWITPVAEPRRFDTRFYLAAMPPGQVAWSDGAETVGVEWVGPSDAVSRATDGEQSILFPTLMNLARLAESSDTGGAIAAAQSRTPYTVEPRIDVRDDGARVITIPAEAGYAATEYVWK
jgi:8-oxo-dGTP pyrophosphatase MutT (NUDIX family)